MRATLSRRNLIIGSAAGVLTGTGSALADIACQPVAPNVNQCTVGIPSIRVDAADPPDQECKMWCWAACIAAVFRINGYRVSQPRIVEKLFGDPDMCAPANGPQIAQAVNGYWISDDDEEFTAYAQPLLDLQFGVWSPYTVAQVANVLAVGEPLINGAVGHATVLTGMQYLVNGFGQSQIQSLVVRDPWNPGGNGAIRRLLRPDEAYGTMLITQISVN